MTVQTLACRRCGMQWEREVKRGPTPQRCRECKRSRSDARVQTHNGGAVYDIHAIVTAYRLAIEMATAALRMNRKADALAALESVVAPMRRGV